MAITMKGIFRGLKIIAQIFTAHREHEIEIGYPTDVRHVSHIGLGAGDSCPSWMNEFRGLDELAAAAAAGGVGASITSAAQSRQTSWASLDFEQPVAALLPAEVCATDSARYGDDAAACVGPGAGAGTPKKARRASRKGRASSPGASAARSSSWRSTASFVTARSDSGELHPGLRAA